MPSITVVSGPAEGNYYPLRARSTIIGRSESCTIQIVDEAVSSQHLAIDSEDLDSGYYARDLKSTNGITINDLAVTGRTLLVDGDRIDLGNSRLIFSTQEFPNRESALAYFKRPGQGDAQTMIQ